MEFIGRLRESATSICSVQGVLPRCHIDKEKNSVVFGDMDYFSNQKDIAKLFLYFG